MSLALRSLVRPSVVAARSTPVAYRAAFSNPHGDDALLQRLKDELKDAMRGKQSDVASTIRSILSEHQYAQKAAAVAGSGLLTVIKKAIAKRRDSASQYVDAKRQDLADKELSEASFLEKYLPAQLNEGELKSAIDSAIAKLKEKGGADGKRLLGAVIKEVKTAVGEGRVDGRALKDAVEKALK